MTAVDAHEEGRQVGLAQASAYLRGEALRLRQEQGRAFDLVRAKQIDMLTRTARAVLKLK